MKPLNLVASTKLESEKVLDVVGHEYGTVKDIIIDPNSNRIIFFIISRGGFAGTEIGSKYVAIPYQSININPNTNAFMLRISLDVINRSPEIDYAALREGKHEVIDEIFNYYGRPEFWKEEERTIESNVSGQTVNDSHNAAQGSELQTQNYPADNSRLTDEMDFDKLTGKSDK